MKWTESQLAAEHAYRLTERLGILCGTREPTLTQRFIAEREADAAVEALRKENEQEETKVAEVKSRS